MVNRNPAYAKRIRNLVGRRGWSLSDLAGEMTKAAEGVPEFRNRVVTPDDVKNRLSSHPSGPGRQLGDWFVHLAAKALRVRYEVILDGREEKEEGAHETDRGPRVGPEAQATSVRTGGEGHHRQHLWVPEHDSPVAYFNIIYDQLMMFKNEKIWSSKVPATRLLTPAAQLNFLVETASSSVVDSYYGVFKLMHDFWEAERRNRGKGRNANRAKITNYLVHEEFVGLVKDRRKLPPQLASEWPRQRVAWLEDLLRQMETNCVMPLFVGKASLLDNPELDRRFSDSATVAVVGDSLLVRRGSGDNEIRTYIGEANARIEDYNESFLDLGRLAKRFAAARSSRPAHCDRKTSSKAEDDSTGSLTAEDFAWKEIKELHYWSRLQILAK